MRFPRIFVSALLLCGVHVLAEAPEGDRAAFETPESAKGAQPSDAPAGDLFDPARHMRVSEVRPGMKGYGVSVFSGTKLERFDVEVVSVLHNMMGPQQNVVLIKCRGQGLEHSGAVAGMSGSPIYLIDDQGRERMIGAFALGWQFAKDPIAGVRPIEEMLRVPTDPKPVKAGEAVAARAWDARELFKPAADKPRALPGRARSASALSAHALRPLSMPLTVSGVDASFLDRAEPILKRSGFDAGSLQLLQAGGAGDAPADAGKDAQLVPGAAVGVPIVSGDLDLSAIGTVTEVIGNRVFAFGHEFNAEGATELPMGVGYIHTVIANQATSFKLGSIIRTDGTLTADESVAVAGLIGKKPRTIPVDMTVRTPQRQQPQTYHYEVTRHPTFTPMGSMMAIGAAIMGHSQLPPEFTINYELQVEFPGGEKLSMSNRTTSLQAASELVRDLQTPLAAALENPFALVYPTRITGTIDITPEIHAAEIRGLSTDKGVYRPGETVKLHVISRKWRGSDELATYELTIPEDQPQGQCAIAVSDADNHFSQQMQFSPQLFQVDNMREVYALLRTMTGNRTDRLYARLTTSRQGLAVGRTALTKLPGSKRALLAGAPAPEVATFDESVTQEYPTQTPMIGAAAVQIVVAREPEKAQRVGTPEQTPQTPDLPQAATPESPHG